MPVEDRESVERRNRLLVQAVSAALGLIPPGVRAIFVQPGARVVTLHFIVEEGGAEAYSDDIREIVGELEARVGSATGVQAQTHSEEAPRDWGSRGWHPIYWARGWAAWGNAPD